MMGELTPEEAERRKRAVFENMSARRQKHILGKGYEKWDPFEEPKDPIDIRKDPSKRTTHQLVREFLQSRSGEAGNNAFNRGVLEMALGIVNGEDRFRGMYEFACWHRDLLKAEGIEIKG
ncbi:MAG: hypothetical protein R6V84_13765 [Desulfobacterales bacterium]